MRSTANTLYRHCALQTMRSAFNKETEPERMNEQKQALLGLRGHQAPHTVWRAPFYPGTKQERFSQRWKPCKQPCRRGGVVKGNIW